MKTESEIAQLIRDEQMECDQTAVNATILRAQLPVLMPLFHSLDLRYCYWYHNEAKVIVGIKTREDLAKIRALYTGVWKKEDALFIGNDDIFKYVASINGVTVDVRITELPPSCRVVEEIIEVPATEAHTKTIRRLVCSEPTKQDAPNGKIIPEVLVEA